MNWQPHNFGGRRTDPEAYKRDGWQADGILVVSPTDKRLSWAEQVLIRQIGDRLYPEIKRGRR
jgi:hypothetical protein